MTATYDICDLIAACKEEQNRVVVLQTAQSSARVDFKLQTNKAVIEFIANDGLESLDYINTKPWMNNPDKNCPIMVDAYSFYSGPAHGYMAFFFNSKTDKWLIKSFKHNKHFVPRDNKFIDQLLAFKAIMREIEEK